VSNPGAALAALRRHVAHTCAVCGKAFSGLSRARYCSNRCRQAAKYARQRSARPDGP
jgi:predicted nucleic acid-binding Zn ribbon protein